VQALVQATMAPLLLQIQQREARLAAQETALLQQQAKLEDARVATLTLANDASVDAAAKGADAANARMMLQQESFATTMEQARAHDAQRHQQHVTAMQAQQNSLLLTLSAMQDRETQRMEASVQQQKDMLEAQRLQMEANNTLLMARWDSMTTAERARMDREDIARKEAAAAALERQREHSRTVLSLREQQAESASGVGQLEKLVELKAVIDQLGGGGDGAEKPLIGQIVDGLKEVAGLGIQMAKMSGASEEAEAGIEEEMGRDPGLQQQAQAQAHAQQQAQAHYAQQQQQAQQQAHAHAQQQAQQQRLLPPPDPFAEHATQQLQAEQRQAVPVGVDPFAPAPQQAAPPPPQQVAPGHHDPFSPNPVPAPAQVLTSRLPAAVLVEARAAFRWAVGQMLQQGPDDWQTTISGALAQAHSTIVPYVQEVGVTRALVEAGAPPPMAARVVAGMKTNPLLAQALQAHHGLVAGQLNWN
jgi:hypothetical protein